MRLTLGQLRGLLREAAEPMPGEPLVPEDLRIDMLIDVGRELPQRVVEFAASDGAIKKTYPTLVDLLQDVGGVDSVKGYVERWKKVRILLGDDDEYLDAEDEKIRNTIISIELSFNGVSIKIWLRKQDGIWTMHGREIGFRRPTIYQLLALMEDEPDRRPDPMLLRYFKVVVSGGDVLDFAWFIHTGIPEMMPDFMRELINTATGYDQKTLSIESVDDASEVQRGLWNLKHAEERIDVDLPNGGWARVNIDELTTDIVSAALGWF